MYPSLSHSYAQAVSESCALTMLRVTESGDLELLMRNKKMQSRYDEWMTGMKTKYGSTGES